MGGSSCNSCSQGGEYFSFGKYSSVNNNKVYVKMGGKIRRVYSDSKGRYYRENSKKRYLPKGTRTFKDKSKIRHSPKKHYSPKKKSKPRGYYLRKNVKTPGRKVVKNIKNKSIGTRLSARTIFNQYGYRSIGRSFNILQKDGNYKKKYLRLRINGSPYFSNNFGSQSVQPLNLQFRISNRHIPHMHVPHMHDGKLCFGG